MKAALAILALLCAASCGVEGLPTSRKLQQLATSAVRMATATAQGTDNTLATTETAVATTPTSASSTGRTFARAVNGNPEGQALAVTTSFGSARDARGGIAIDQGHQIAQGDRSAVAYGFGSSLAADGLAAAINTGGAYATNWPASYGYGKVISHPFKEEVVQPRPAFVSVANNFWTLGTQQP